MFVTIEEYKDRYSICKSCTSFFDPLKTCRECGCFMIIKAKLDFSECPKNLWNKTVTPISIELEDIE